MAFHAIFLVLLVVLSFVLITKNPSAGTVAEILGGTVIPASLLVMLWYMRRARES